MQDDTKLNIWQNYFSDLVKINNTSSITGVSMYSPWKNMVDISVIFEVFFQSFKCRNNKYGIATTVISEIAWLLVVLGSVMGREGKILCCVFIL